MDLTMGLLQQPLPEEQLLTPITGTTMAKPPIQSMDYMPELTKLK
jgi:hypothetical protein